MNKLRSFLLSAIAMPVLLAAPQLRLSETAIGPVSIATGQNGPARTVEMTNAGDGTLNISLRSSATWAAATVGAPRLCSIFGASGATCTPINIALNTSSLAAGTYTAAITASDPNAVDAPQTITVTVAIGGTVPDNVTLFVTPDAGSTARQSFTSNSILEGAAATTSGGNWMRLAFEGSGSFSFVLPYAVVATNPGGLAEGSYIGTMRMSGSALPADNKTINVTMRVTSQPIMALNQNAFAMKAATGLPSVIANIVATNRGRGTLALTAPTVELQSPPLSAGTPWLRADLYASLNIVQLVADATNLGAGTYTAVVTINSNAANGPIRVPVSMEVSPRSAPIVTAGGVVNNATFTANDRLGKGVIAAVFGDQFLIGNPVAATALPLQTTMAGARVLVNDIPAPVYFVSYGQINFQIPYDAREGAGTVVVESNGQRSNRVAITIADRAPRLLRLGIGDYGIAVNGDGSYPLPRNAVPGVNTRPARVGEVIVIYAIGLGPTTPGVVSGAASPSSPLAAITPAPRMHMGALSIAENISYPTQFVGLTPGFVGLYQINVQIPPDVDRGPRVPMFLNLGNNVLSNTVELAIE
ncbi:MAG: hypothetical protein FJW32_23635 [Acidobacteria bacterium]|nr:hypothetical protein [Acidobacteriota bacterium]